MSLSKYVLTALVAGLLLVSASAFAAKPDSNNCPCYKSDPGLYYEVVNIANTTCVEILDRERVVIAKNAKNWYLDVLTPVGSSCVHLQLQESLQAERKSCYVRTGATTENGGCWGGDSFISVGLTDREYEDCKYAMNDAYRYLETVAMCD